MKKKRFTSEGLESTASLFVVNFVYVFIVHDITRIKIYLLGKWNLEALTASFPPPCAI